MSGHLRVAAPASTDPIPVDEAIDRARQQLLAARNAYVDALHAFGQSGLLSLLRSEEKVTVRRLHATRDEAQRLVDRARAVVVALDACIDTCERADR